MMDKVIVSIVGFLGIIFTYWFFLKRGEKQVTAEREIDITVEGGYSPEVISIQKGKPIKINFLRKDPTDCLSEVVLADFKIRKDLPLNKRVSIEITPQKSGEFVYSCGMNMYHGKIVVR